MISKKLLNFTLVMVSFIFLCSSVFAQQSDIAEVNSNGSSVSFNIKVPYRSATLTVSTPDGKTFRKEFQAGTVPTFASDLYGNGSFTYELTLSPILSGTAQNALKNARRDGKDDEVVSELRKSGELPAPMIQSGNFRVLDNQLITGNEGVTENDTIQPVGKVKTNSSEKVVDGGNTPEAQTITQDLIVQGSICTGFDCSTSESFGFDTFRLKENNIRIHFEDTSVGTFPSNDWRITINDTSSGGASFFAIDDASGGKTPFKIEAGAINNALYVDSNGDVGIGTSTPVVELHAVDGNTPALRLEQNGSEGFTAQTWDVAGNETNFFIRDVTNSSSLPFRIRPGSGNANAIDIQSNGIVRFEKGIEVKVNGSFVPLSPEAGSTPTYLFGGGGSVTPDTIANASVDPNDNSVRVTSGVSGNVVVRYNLPSNANLANTDLGFIQYTVRYQDSDGTSNAASRVRLTFVSVDLTTGAFTNDAFFDSNLDASTTVNTITGCKAINPGFFDFANKGTYLTALLRSPSTTAQTQLHQVSLKRVSGCP